jgi:hypothetical protein
MRPRFPQRRQERVDDRQSAEHIDLELMPHGVERQNLQRPGSENAGVINEEA